MPRHMYMGIHVYLLCFTPVPLHLYTEHYHFLYIFLHLGFFSWLYSSKTLSYQGTQICFVPQNKYVNKNKQTNKKMGKTFQQEMPWDFVCFDFLFLAMLSREGHLLPPCPFFSFLEEFIDNSVGGDRKRKKAALFLILHSLLPAPSHT